LEYRHYGVHCDTLSAPSGGNVPMQTLSGRQLGGFSIGERLALGGMAAIYRATQISTEREVAVKVLPLHLAADPKLIARFEREARVLAALQHPHILPLIDFGREGDWLYLVTPLIPHGDLAERSRAGASRCRWTRCGGIMRQLTDALDTAHRAGIVHRDLKPANVLLDARGNCLLSDFGIAKLEGAMGLTAAGTTLGTPEYMAPEQGAGRPVDARCDIYALGVILYELCTHRVPFEAESPTALLLKHLTEPPPPPRRFNAKLPPELEHVILRALAKEPAARYPSAEAMGRAIAHAIPAGSEGATSTRETVVMRKRRVRADGGAAARRARAAQPARRRGGGASWARRACWAFCSRPAAWWQLRERAIAPEASPPPVAAPAATERPADVAPTPTTPAAESPAPAAAPVAESPAPIASAGAYDDFDDAPFDGSFDPARWAASAGSTSTRAVQNGGVLRIETRAQFQGVYALRAPPPGTRAHARAGARAHHRSECREAILRRRHAQRVCDGRDAAELVGLVLPVRRRRCATGHARVHRARLDQLPERRSFGLHALARVALRVSRRRSLGGAFVRRSRRGYDGRACRGVGRRHALVRVADRVVRGRRAGRGRIRRGRDRLSGANVDAAASDALAQRDNARSSHRSSGLSCLGSTSSSSEALAPVAPTVSLRARGGRYLLTGR
jgi:serine/threonine-protein kinase